MSTNDYGQVSTNGYHELSGEDLMPPEVKLPEVTNEAASIIELLQRSASVAEKLLERLGKISSRLDDRLGPDPLPDDLIPQASELVQNEDQVEVDSLVVEFPIPDSSPATSQGAILQQRDLYPAMKVVVKAAGRDKSNPVVSHVLIEAEAAHIRLTCFNGEMTLQQCVPAQTAGLWKAAIPARNLYEAARRLTGELTLTLAGNLVELRAGDTVCQFTTLEDAEFPEQLEEEVELVTVPAGALRTALRQVLPCAEVTKAYQSQSYRHGVYIQATGSKLSCVATDGYRLASRTVPGVCSSPAMSLLIPLPASKVLAELLPKDGDLSVTIRTAAGRAVIEVPGYELGKRIVRTQGNATLTTKLVDAKFPDYERIFPTVSSTVTMDREAALAACQRIITLLKLEKEVPNATLAISPDRVLLTTEAQRIGETLPAELIGDEALIKINLEFLRDCLQVMRSNYFTLGWTSPSSPVTITGLADKGLTWVAMPVRD